MNKEKINEVGELLEVDTSDIKETKFKTIMKKLTYPLVQITFFLITSISGVLFGYWENRVPSGYPYASFTRIYRAGIPTILIIHSGNAVFSTKTHRKFGLSKFHAILIIILNIVISIASFVLLYIAIENVPHFSGIVAYDTYRKPKSVK